MSQHGPQWLQAYAQAGVRRAEQGQWRQLRGRYTEPQAASEFVAQATQQGPIRSRPLDQSTIQSIETRGAADDIPLLADFSHNDYLGLSRHPALLAAAHQAIDRWGTGATGSRLLSGDLSLFTQFEARIAADKHSEAALIFNSGYQANASALATLLDAAVLGAEPQVYTDRLNHASLHHACRLAGVRQRRYRHLDLDHLDQLLRQRDLARPTVVVSETVFGMEGDQVDVARLRALAREHNALLYLDDAHGTGLIGMQGYGTSVDNDSACIVMGTFSKALGAAGAYVAASRSVIDYLINHCSGFIYSTAPAPAAVAAAQAAWQLLPSLHPQRLALFSASKQLRIDLNGLGYPVGDATSDTPIIPVLIGESARAQQWQSRLRSQGVQLSLVRPPTVPPGTARLRIALSAAHTAAQRTLLLSALQP